MTHRLRQRLVAVVSIAAGLAGVAAIAALHEPPAPVEDRHAAGSDQLWPGTAAWADATLASLTLEQKVSQLFSARAYAYFTSTDADEYERLVDLVERFEIGGITFFQGEPLEQAVLANDLQQRARVPLLIAQDMEWGAGMRVEHTTTLPRTMALGATRDPRLAYAAGVVTAEEARALGTRHVFAPVADVNNNPLNPIINVRSFGEDPGLVAELASAFAEGVQDRGVLSTAKHFPGHGDTDVDSHADLPVLTFDRARLDTVELVPFRRLVQDGVMGVMTGHLALPEVEPDAALPASLSPRVTTALLRDELGFEGLIVTDGLDMRGLTKQYGVQEAAVRALEAGADMLLLSEDAYAARAAILRAVREGRLSEARIDRSVRRVLQAKAWTGLDQGRTTELDHVRAVVSSAPHRAVSAAIAHASLTLLRNEGGLLPLTSGAARVLSVTLSDGRSLGTGRPFQERLGALLKAGRLEQLHLDRRSPRADYQQAMRAARRADVVVVPAFVSVRSYSGTIGLAAEHKTFLEELMRTGTPVVLVAFGSPYMVLGLSQPAAYVVAYGSSPASQRAAAEALAGQAGFHGRLPVTIPDLYAYGDGIRVEQQVVREVLPEEVGMNGRQLRRVDSLLQVSVAHEAFPGAAIAIGRGLGLAKLGGYGYHTYDAARPVTPQSLFDLASLTKVVATTTAAMKLYEQGRLDLQAPVARYLPAFGANGKDKVTIWHLLTHTSGLVAYRPFHKSALRTREAVVDAIMSETLLYEPGTESRYSDFGMITLALVVEQITGQSFGTYVQEAIFEPLGMKDTGFRPAKGVSDPSVVPTEIDFHFRHRLVQGEVHDETAYILGGTAGHAGLFSTAEDLARFAAMLLNEGRYLGQQFLRPETIRLFTTRAGERGRHTRALGWDTPSDEGYTSAGQRFGPHSFGHTGFTGTSLWVDPEQDLFVVLLTNRVYPTRENKKHVPVRPQLADLAAASIVGPPAPLLPEPSR